MSGFLFLEDSLNKVQVLTKGSKILFQRTTVYKTRKFNNLLRILLNLKIMSFNFSPNDWEVIKDSIIKSIVSNSVRFVLNVLINIIHKELQPIEEKVNKLINNPFVTAERHLELALNYPEHSISQINELNFARNLFSKAASNLNGLPETKALLAAATCCFLMNDLVGMKFFKDKSLDNLREYHTSLIKQYTSFTNRLNSDVGVGSMLLTLTGIGLCFTGVGLPAGIAAFTTAGIAAATLPNAIKLSNAINESSEFGKLITEEDECMWPDTSTLTPRRVDTNRRLWH